MDVAEREKQRTVIISDLQGLAKSIETDEGIILVDSNYIEEDTD